MNQFLYDNVESLLHHRPVNVRSLSGGCVGEVYLIEFRSAPKCVAKIDRASSGLLTREAHMLSYLRQETNLPVPEVLGANDMLLLMEYLAGDSRFSDPAQKHAATLLAELHAIGSDQYGHAEDTLIGGLHQPNPRMGSWLDFFGEWRLMYMAQEALKAGRLPGAVIHRLSDLVAVLDRWIEAPQTPALIHGDIWTTNVLARNDQITGFIDPAIYFADPEIELAFITLFNTFGSAFFERYHALRPIKEGFWEERKDIYNLYPLLVHVRLFGGGYVGSVERTLKRFGF